MIRAMHYDRWSHVIRQRASKRPGELPLPLHKDAIQSLEFLRCYNSSPYAPTGVNRDDDDDVYDYSSPVPLMSTCPKSTTYM